MASSPNTPAYAEPSYAKSDRKKTDYPWYLPNIDKHLVPETQKFLLEYSNVSIDEQSAHVHIIRDQAWDIRSYPCTGLGVFLVPFISLSPAYPIILERLKADALLLDVGCFLGGDLRRLVYDGAPSENLYGVDIVSHWDVGFSFFRDQDRFKAQFIEADITAPNTPALQALEGKIDILSVSAVLHQWDWKDHVRASKRLVAFTKPGTLVVGYQIGSVEGKEVMNQALGYPQYKHDPATFAKMWDQVGEETGTQWKTEARLLSWKDMGWDPKDQAWMSPDDRVLDFVVTRVR